MIKLGKPPNFKDMFGNEKHTCHIGLDLQLHLNEAAQGLVTEGKFFIFMHKVNSGEIILRSQILPKPS